MTLKGFSCDHTVDCEQVEVPATPFASHVCCDYFLRLEQLAKRRKHGVEYGAAIEAYRVELRSYVPEMRCVLPR